MPLNFDSLHKIDEQHPADEGAGAVVSPSGHIYSKEAILEYLLKKSKEIKEMEVIFNEQEVRV